MIEKEIKFKGLDGKVHSETWFFNLNEAEVTRLEASFDGGMVAYIESFDENTPKAVVLALFEKLLQLSVGKVSDDGTRFIKSDEIVGDFLASPAYSALFVELGSDTDSATSFFNNVLSKTYVEPPRPKSAQ